jgi:cbb3-type cytochrome oxidase subunit 1
MIFEQVSIVGALCTVKWWYGGCVVFFFMFDNDMCLNIFYTLCMKCCLEVNSYKHDGDAVF